MREHMAVVFTTPGFLLYLYYIVRPTKHRYFGRVVECVDTDSNRNLQVMRGV